MHGRRQGFRNQYPVNRMDSFMFGQRPVSPPVERSTFPANFQQISPAKLINGPQLTKGLSGLSGILNNVQQVLQVVETTTPIIKEYGPMVKNLPAMYRMMKAFKEVNDEENHEEETAVKKNKEQEKHTGQEKKQKTKKPKQTGVSTPKLYV